MVEGMKLEGMKLANCRPSPAYVECTLALLYLKLFAFSSRHGFVDREGRARNLGP
jgi:hypothetical protein